MCSGLCLSISYLKSIIYIEKKMETFKINPVKNSLYIFHHVVINLENFLCIFHGLGGEGAEM